MYIIYIGVAIYSGDPYMGIAFYSLRSNIPIVSDKTRYFSKFLRDMDLHVILISQIRERIIR